MLPPEHEKNPVQGEVFRDRQQTHPITDASWKQLGLMLLLLILIPAVVIALVVALLNLAM